MPALRLQPGRAPSLTAVPDAHDGLVSHQTRLIAPQPSAAVGLTRQGLALFSVGDLGRAEQAFRTVVEVAPDQAIAWNNLALVLVALGQAQQATAALRRSLGIDAKQLVTWNSLANVLAGLGDIGPAEQACAAALALDPNCAGAWQTRAFVRVQAEDFAGAAEAFSRSIDLAGEDAVLYLNLGATLLKCGRFAQAQIAFATSLTLDPVSPSAIEFNAICDLIVAAIEGRVTEPKPAQSTQAFKTALLLLNGADQSAAAARVAEAWAGAYPDDLEAAHLCDAALFRAVSRQPAELVAQHFDGIAEDFEERLVRRLGYRGPERLLSLIAQHLAPKGLLDILDLGCGTGLCAPMLRPFARRLVGIDLSTRMLTKAKALDLYERLEVADLIAALNHPSEQWDMLIAADTLPYLGDLEPVFSGAARVLRSQGWFAFSTEAVDGDDFLLQPNGRYSHGDVYIERLAAHRFQIVQKISGTLRREAGRAVMGDFFLLRRLA